MLTLAQKQRFQDALVEWFTRNGRDYPWRRTRDPYAILVSEVMLQQTTIPMVLERRYFENWLDVFPDVHALAAAPEPRLLKAWEGLGYYNRARNLQRAARAIIARHGSIFPRTLPEIRALPGVGRYTAGAVLSFAFDQPAAIVDGNVARVLARLFNFQREVDAPDGRKQIWKWAEALLPARRTRAYNSALMELGQRVCTVRAPACGICPVRHWCRAENPEALPNRRPRRKIVRLEEEALFAVRNGKVLLEQEGGSRRRGLWKLPARNGAAGRELIWEGGYSITHHRVHLRVFAAAAVARAAANQKWFRLTELPAVAIPSPYRRALEAVLGGGKLRPERSSDTLVAAGELAPTNLESSIHRGPRLRSPSRAALSFIGARDAGAQPTAQTQPQPDQAPP